MVAQEELHGLTDPSMLPDAVLRYLLPASGRPGRRAHQYTVNGFTYPFLVDHGFAAVPNPGESAPRYADMLAGICMSRPGDLLFLFSADPRPAWSASNRRGIYGIFRVTSQPFQGDSVHVDPKTGYEVMGECPAGCGSTTSQLPRFDRASGTWVANPCPACGATMPSSGMTWAGKPYPSLVLPWRVSVEPIVLFDNPVTDERAYSDWEDPGTIWVGRHDNQSAGTGRGGKGSSIRQLTAEEAHKLTRLLVEENGPTTTQLAPATNPYTGTVRSIENRNGSPATDALVKRRPLAGDCIRGEFFLAVAVAREFDDRTGSFAQSAGVQGDLQSLEYASVFYPWGYTNATSDFVMRFVDDEARPFKVVVVELKEDRITDGIIGNPGALVQLGMYVPWVVSRLIHNAPALPEHVEVVPIALGARMDAGAAAPDEYQDVLSTPRGNVPYTVKAAKFVQYQPAAVYKDSSGDERAGRIIFSHDPKAPIARISWLGRHALASSGEEMKLVRSTSWSDARQAAGLTP